MRVLVRVLAALLGLALAAAGVLVAIEVVAAWASPLATTGMLLPWPEWRAAADGVRWWEPGVRVVAGVVAGAGLLLLLVGATARRARLELDGPAPDVAATTTPQVLARLVGRRVRAADDVLAASVTASRRRIAVHAEGRDGGDALRERVERRVEDLLDEVPLPHRPRVVVTVERRGGLR